MRSSTLFTPKKVNDNKPSLVSFKAPVKKIIVAKVLVS